MNVHLNCIESLHPGATKTHFFEKPLAGSYAMAAILDIVVALESGALSAFPKLKLFYDTMIKLPAFEEVKDLDMLLKRGPIHPPYIPSSPMKLYYWYVTFCLLQLIWLNFFL
jgi:hypothetical protein